VSEYPNRPTAEALLRDAEGSPRLTVYLAAAPGAGKTRRLLEDALRAQAAGVRVTIGWIETKGRPELDALAAGLPRLPPRRVTLEGSTFEDFDLEAALAAGPQLVVLDELAHSNLEGSANPKRWQDALALRERGIGVLGALNVMHLEHVAGAAEALIGFPIREIVPLSFLEKADQVIALDVSPDVLETRLLTGAIVRSEDIERARAGIFRPQTIRMLREMLLRTVDDFVKPPESARHASTAIAFLTSEIDAAAFMRRSAALADVLDLALEVASANGVSADVVRRLAAEHGAEAVTSDAFSGKQPFWNALRASLVIVPPGALARRIADGPIEHDIAIIDAPSSESSARSAGERTPYGQTIGDRLRIGYGRLIVYLGAAAGCGKTYAMLDRAHQLKEEGVDVVAALVETHGRPDTIAKLAGIEELPRLGSAAAQAGHDVQAGKSDRAGYGELDFDAVMRRRPAVALIDELAHTNAPGSPNPKRYDDVMSVLRAGITVITTLNVQHLEGLNDAVFQLTGQRVREIVPDAILEFADDVVLIDVPPETLRERLRAGKIYPRERIDQALGNFFRTENLSALRELALREVVHARAKTPRNPPVARLLLGVKARERDQALIDRCARLASRLEIDLVVAHIASSGTPDRRIEGLEARAQAVRARWRFIAAKDAPKALVAAAEEVPGTALAIEGFRTRPRWPSGPSFARKLLEAGSRRLLLLAPHAPDAQR
jgi:two-component system sensor histidine kinase KdpD